jgi:dephospho-CoA kinase
MRIGLTGGIGSGKSTVGQMLADCGAVWVDTDAISRSLSAPGGAAMPRLQAEFGAQVVRPDGGLDRDQMRQLAFSDPTAKSRLESILHPMIQQITRDQAAAAGQRPVVFDVPLLTESGHWRGQVDRILVVDCTEETQCRRVMLRNGWTEAQVRQVMAKQASREQRRAIADAVIYNEDLSLDELRAQVLKIWQHWVPASPAAPRAVEQ